jgi:SAM-dependent methyltransferase
MIFENILKVTHAEVLQDLLDRCVTAKNSIIVDSIHELALSAARATNAGATLPPQLNALLERWYDSLPSGNPDYSVYGEDEYIAELWACWKVYSRTHLLNIQKDKCLPSGSITDAHKNAQKVVDLGCGFAYTTSAIKQIFPNAAVHGTNLDGTLQMDVAKTMATDYGFSMHGDPNAIKGPTDLVFASEYFEHMDRPIDHLDEVIDILQPGALLIANAFGPTAIGHFREYSVCRFPAIGHEMISAKETGRIFNERMKAHGYTKVKTRLWNNRPAYWVKNS